LIKTADRAIDWQHFWGDKFQAEDLWVYSENLTGSLKKAKINLNSKRFQERFQTLKNLILTNK